MPTLNKVMLMGNCTRDPEVRYTPKGTAVAELGLAVNEYSTNDAGERTERTTFVDVTLWGRQAEIAGEYLKKGRPVFIEGRLQLDTWDDKQSGQKRSKLKVVGENLQLLGSKPDEDQEPKAPSQRGTGTYREPGRKPPVQAPRPPADPDLDVGEDDIPF